MDGAKNCPFCADVVEVIRCGQCEYASSNDTEQVYCKRLDVLMLKNDDFCSLGKRRDAQQEKQ